VFQLKSLVFKNRNKLNDFMIKLGKNYEKF